MNTRRESFGRRRILRGAIFRVAAVLLALAPLVAVEGLFRWLDWGRPDYAEDPFLGFHSVRPLFEPSQDGATFRIPKTRQAFFCPESFACQKLADEFRVFCLGGSTVQGRPFAIETSFTTWLELSLQAADPSRTWQVVNCGGVSYASYRLVPILQEVLQYEPDLIIVYTGHDEFLEDRTYGHIKHMPEFVAAPASLLLRMRTYTLLHQGHLRLRPRPSRTPQDFPVLLSEVDAMLDYRDGLDDYHRDRRWRHDTVRHFEYNLRRMVHLCDRVHVPLLLVDPVSNLRDCPPFKVQHRDGLTAEERQRWQTLVDQARQCQASDPQRAVRLLCGALAIDDQHAGLHYLLGCHYDALNMTDAARRHFVLAKETDICPLRMLEPMHRALEETAEETGTPLVAVRGGFERLSRGGIPDGRYLVDHVHPSIEGHKLIADWLMDELSRQGIVQPVAGWQQARDRAYRQHFESLDDLYFFQGSQRLENLRRWTQGRADGVRGQTPATRTREITEHPP